MSSRGPVNRNEIPLPLRWPEAVDPKTYFFEHRKEAQIAYFNPMLIAHPVKKGEACLVELSQPRLAGDKGDLINYLPVEDGWVVVDYHYMLSKTQQGMRTSWVFVDHQYMLHKTQQGMNAIRQFMTKEHFAKCVVSETHIVGDERLYLPQECKIELLSAGEFIEQPLDSDPLKAKIRRIHTDMLLIEATGHKELVDKITFKMIYRPLYPLDEDKEVIIYRPKIDYSPDNVQIKTLVIRENIEFAFTSGSCVAEPGDILYFYEGKYKLVPALLAKTVIQERGLCSSEPRRFYYRQGMSPCL